jgi:hypothetical protein
MPMRPTRGPAHRSRRADAHSCGHRSVLRDRPHFQPETRESQHAEQRDEHREGEADDPEAVVRDGDTAEIEGATHPGRVADFLVGRSEDGAHRLLQDQ